MKTFISLIALMAIMSLNVYGQNSDVNALLEKPETRKEIINKILNDHNYMSEFIRDMHGNQHAMAMMNGNYQMNGNQGRMGMNGNTGMMGNQSQSGMNGNGRMGGNSGNMGMNGNNQMMNHSYMMNMMTNNPAQMRAIMGNMMDVVSTDSVMTGYMGNMIASHPRMWQWMTEQMNNNRNSTAEVKKK